MAAAANHGIDPASCDLDIALDLRYGGQAYELTVWFDGARAVDARHLRAAFAKVHDKRYGYARDKLQVEAVNYRTRVVQRRGTDGPPLTTPAPGADAATETTTGTITLGGQVMTAAFVSRAELPAGFTADGPMVVEEPTATTLVPPNWRFSVLESGDLMLESMDP